MYRKKISWKQKEFYMNLRNEGATQELAAIKTDISVRSAKRIEGCKPNSLKAQGRTRKDPLEEVWETELIPLLEREPALQALTLLEYLQDNYPEKYDSRLLRTLQRRVKHWKAIYGPEREVIFRQNHPPGFQGLSDFTKCNDLNITIRGIFFPHLLYHFYLAYSNWEYVSIVQGGESFSALSEGLQNALHELGGSPKTHRTDSLSAAYKNKSSEDDFTEAYKELCANYNMIPTRNNKGESHENGSVEVSHYHFSTALKQALMIRGSKEFNSIDEYRKFLKEIQNKKNSKRLKVVQEEKLTLQQLPNRKSRDFDVETIRVNSSSIILVRQVRYAVPSTLINSVLKVHLYDDRLECYLGATLVLTLKRLRWKGGEQRLRSIDYRFLIPALARKPQAFRNYIYRDDLFPNDIFKRVWEVLDSQLDDRTACKEMVKILKIAADTGREEEISKFLEGILLMSEVPRLHEVEIHFCKVNEKIIPIEIESREISSYDSLLQEETILTMKNSNNFKEVYE
jgi:hypothetical protein